MENESSVSISVAGTSPQSQDAGRRGQTLHTSTGAMVAANARGVGHCSAAQMGQPPAQGSEVDVEGTRAALPIAGCPP